MDISVTELRERCRQLTIRDLHHDVLELLQPVPLKTIHADEDLAFWHALALLTTVRYVDGKQAVEAYRGKYSSPDNPLWIGRGLLLQSHLCIMEGNTEASYNLELEAASILPENAYHERLRSWATIDTMAGHMGDTSRMEQAIEALADVRNNLPFDQSWWYSFVVPNRADILAKRGFLAKAETLLLTQLSSVPQDEIGILKVRLAAIALEHNDPVKAGEWLEGIALDAPEDYWTTEAHLIASRVEYLLGNSDRARQVLEDGMAKNARGHVRAELFRFQFQMCELWIQEGQIELAEAWVSLASKALDPWPRTFGHPIPNLILAQLEMAKGNWVRAIRLLEDLQDEGVRRNHKGLLVGIYAHLAYAHAHASNDKTDISAKYVNLATVAGAKGNFSKSLTVFGSDICTLLADSAEVPGATSADPILVSSKLSQREIQVLSMVAAGMRNAEIAETLFLSLSTVKNHLSNIFKRLGVSNRQAAVQAAEEMGILRDNIQMR